MSFVRKYFLCIEKYDTHVGYNNFLRNILYYRHIKNKFSKLNDI